MPREKIIIGEEAYVDLDKMRQKSSGIHISCMNSTVQESERCEYSNSSGWRYIDTYRRSETLSWIPGPLPEEDEVCGYMESSPGMINMTGYDLVAFLKDWLRHEGYEHLSVSEIILTESKFCTLETIRGNRQYLLVLMRLFP